jgi:hypothetical protein
MDSHTLYEIQIVLEEIVLLINQLPTWGMIAFTLFVSSLSSKLGIGANIAIAILFYNIFSPIWGLLVLAVGAISFVFFGLLAAFLD